MVVSQLPVYWFMSKKLLQKNQLSAKILEDFWIPVFMFESLLAGSFGSVFLVGTDISFSHFSNICLECWLWYKPVPVKRYWLEQNFVWDKWRMPHHLDVFVVHYWLFHLWLNHLSDEGLHSVTDQWSVYDCATCFVSSCVHLCNCCTAVSL